MKLVTIIDIGSSSIRMVIAEIYPDGSWNIIDRAGKPVSLGMDVFNEGFISRKSLIHSLQILAGFKEIIKMYKIPSESIRAVATSALRAAKNRDTFIDRVAVRTGIRVKVIEGIEENRLTYLATQYAVQEMKPQLARSNSLIIEVGGGSTEIMLLQRGKIVAAHSLGIGTVRIIDELETRSRSGQYLEQVLDQRIQTMSEILNEEMKLRRIRYFIAVGGDARVAAAKVGRRQNTLYSIIEKNNFEDFTNRVTNYSLDDCVNELQISYDEADGLASALLMYLFFMNKTQADHLIVPDISIREGILLDMTMDIDLETQENFKSQTIASALNLGKKFHFGEKHAKHVTKLALILFDLLKEEHNLDSHCRLLLEISGLLHDIGTYIRTSGHHKHGQYIISNSEVFGLNRDDMIIIANIVRYHRKALPLPSHSSYISLPREERIQVMKLGSILRVADALDRGHTQRIMIEDIEKNEGEILLKCSYRGDISIERLGLETKSNMFEEVYGYTVGITESA